MENIMFNKSRTVTTHYCYSLTQIDVIMCGFVGEQLHVLQEKGKQKREDQSLVPLKNSKI